MLKLVEKKHKQCKAVVEGQFQNLKKIVGLPANLGTCYKHCYKNVIVMNTEHIESLPDIWHTARTKAQKSVMEDIIDTIQPSRIHLDSIEYRAVV